MLQRLRTRFRSSDIDLKLLIPVLICATLVQVIAAVIRMTTSYRAIELGLSTVWLGIIAAAFALLPIFVAVRVGRLIDRGLDAHSIWVGSVLQVMAATVFILWQSAEALIAANALMGLGHLMLMASQQMLCVRAATPRSMERVFGNYMVAGAIGQGIGPYVVGWIGGSATVPPTQILFAVGLAITVVSLLTALAIRPARDRPKAGSETAVVPIGNILRMPGLPAVVVAGVIMVSASDIILIYAPLIGTERSIDVKDIGLLLAVRALTSLVARMFYARLVEAVGRWPLIIASTLACALTFGALAIPLPLIAMHGVMAVMGFSFGLATTLSITIVVGMTTASGARATANSLRIMANRIGQFALPFGAGVAAAATGLGGLFILIAAAMGASGMAMFFKRPR